MVSFPPRKLLKKAFPNDADRSTYTTFLTKLVKHKGSQRSPDFILMFGPPGSGKSSFVPIVMKKLDRNTRDFVEANVDSIVENSPAWKQLLLATTPTTTTDDTKQQTTAATNVSAEQYFDLRRKFGNKLCDDLVRYCFHEHISILFETTGGADLNMTWIKRLLRDAIRQGYQLTLVWPFVDRNDLQNRVVERTQKSGRTVDASYVNMSFEQAPQQFFNVLPLFDHVLLYDNSTMEKHLRETAIVEYRNSSAYHYPTISCDLHLAEMVSLYDSQKEVWNKFCSQHWKKS